ncbi:uncharacterized protein B0H18DRAFT_1121407 [Fomitopsis serialis]|uniref:uncharacterized protein n=1 Tax=Fomitopsis serialis TaxID=139415 RepID=UPI00200897E9|nr:uncharacterized protein B0H18DRAFT_1121407 [Neoantrodia serialis]KAH9921441.1 hypothetical protein B0H18DRAFT_1121407 [Neoantrodia serialis]
MSGRQQRVMVQPINVIFKNLHSKVVIWLYDNIEMRIEGESLCVFGTTSLNPPCVKRRNQGGVDLLLALRFRTAAALLVNHIRVPPGFDEFMNVVVDEAAEVYVKDAKPRRDLGRILLKGITSLYSTSGIVTLCAWIDAVSKTPNRKFRMGAESARAAGPAYGMYV